VVKKDIDEEVNIIKNRGILGHSEDFFKKQE